MAAPRESMSSNCPYGSSDFLWCLLIPASTPQYSSQRKLEFHIACCFQDESLKTFIPSRPTQHTCKRFARNKKIQNSGLGYVTDMPFYSDITFLCFTDLMI